MVDSEKSDRGQPIPQQGNPTTRLPLVIECTKSL